MSKVNMVDLNKFANGALAARFNEELQKILSNIGDPNTDASKVRTLTVQVKISGDDKRDILGVSVIAKSSLQHAKEVSTKLIMDRDSSGKFVGKELMSGVKDQMFIDKEGDVAKDTGEKVISFKTQSK